MSERQIGTSREDRAKLIRWMPPLLVALGLTIVIALVAISSPGPTGTFEASGGYSTMVPRAAINKPLVIGIEERNVAKRAPLVLRSVSFPEGLPRHISLVREGAVRWSDEMIDSGWPPPGDRHIARRLKPLAGYTVAPGQTFVVILEFSARVPGRYVFRSITLHADGASNFDWLPFGHADVRYVDTGTFAFCVGRSAWPLCAKKH